MAEAREQRQYKATMFLAIWQGNFIGVGFGAWMFTFGEGDRPTRWAFMVVVWLGATHYEWNRARRVFWPDDTGQF